MNLARGKMSESKRRIAAAVLAGLALPLGAGCEISSPEGSHRPPAGDPPGGSGSLTIWGGISPDNVGLNVERGSTFVTDAEVRVNGIPIPLNTDPTIGLKYFLRFDPNLATGTALNVEVDDIDKSLFAHGTIPETPTLTFPTENTVYASSDDVVLSWTSASSPQGGFSVSFRQNDCLVSSCYAGNYKDFDGSARTGLISASELPNAENITLELIAYNPCALGTVDHPAGGYCGMGIESLPQRIDIHRNLP